MARLSRTICAVVVLLAAVNARGGPVAELLTVGPGDEVWERYGHNMIRIKNAETGFDVCYNWGVFDFRKPNFIGNFVRGRMLYTMFPYRGHWAADELNEYHKQNRRVTSQRLKLTPEQFRDLYLRCEYNAEPRNADYRYDYFRDNCSTRVRDMLDGVTGLAIGNRTKGKPTTPPLTYRHETLRLTQADFWVSLGIDFAGGPNTDRPLDRWQEGFLPAAVSVAAQEAGIADAPVELWPSTRPPPPAAPPVRWPGLLAVGLAWAAVMLLVRRAAAEGRLRRPAPGGRKGRDVLIRAAYASPVALWWLISGFGGVFMTYMWTLTDHTAAHANQNLWHFSPLAWVALGLTIIRRRRAAWRVAVLIATVSITGIGVWGAGRFGGPFTQSNGGFVLLALPINVAAAWATRPALTKPTAADDMPG